MSRTCPSCGNSFDDDVFFCGEDGQIVIQDQPPDDMDGRLGTRLGGYIVAARVADGAMGRVYEGRHPETKARVAIKVLHSNVAKDHVSVERFKREYETAEELDHPYIVKVLEFGETNDASYFMTMEFLEGEELSKAFADGARQTPGRVVRVISQVAEALDCAHSFGFIHRDLKPDNIFLCREADGDSVRLLDFGSVKLQMEMGAKLTAIGTTLGSPYYMSPEQATGAADLDQRTDVFALGAILYEMLTSKVAFEGPNIAMILMKIMNEHPPAPGTLGPWPTAVDDVVDRALRKDKEERFGSAGEFANALIQAFGLEGTAKDWATRPESEIVESLKRAAPPAPREYAESLSPPEAGASASAAAPSAEGAKPVAAAKPAAPAPAARASEEHPRLPAVATASKGRGAAVLGLAAAGLVVVGLLAYLMR